MASFGDYQDAAMPTPGATPPSSPRRDPAEERLRAMETMITGMQATLGTFADKVNSDMKGLNDGFQVDLAETKAGVGDNCGRGPERIYPDKAADPTTAATTTSSTRGPLPSQQQRR